MRIIRIILVYSFFLFIILSCSTESTPVYTLTTNVIPSEAGTINPSSGEYDEGTTVEIQATANEHWIFSRWEGDVSSFKTTVTTEMVSDKSVTAIFNKKNYPLTTDVLGEGEIIEEVIQAKTTGYSYGTVVKLNANPANGWEFVEWQGDLSGSQNPQTVTVEESTNITAVFKRSDFALTIDVVGEGTVEEAAVTSKSTDYPFETLVELTARPADGWEFQEWRGDTTGTENPFIVKIEQEIAITAVFKRADYSLLIDVTGKGTVKEEVTKPKSTDYQFGSVIKLTAEASLGWRFREWSGDVSGKENPVTVKIDRDKEVEALFVKDSYSINLEKEGKGSATYKPNKDKYSYGEKVTFNAKASNDSIFMGWSGTFNSGESEVVIEIEEDIDVTARFKKVTDVLVYRFSGGSFINGRVYSASLSLANNLPESIQLTKLVLLNSSGTQIAATSDETTIHSGSSVSYSVSFNIPPTESAFSKYQTVWHVKYKGKNYKKQNQVGYIGSSAKIDPNTNRTFELNVE